MITMLCSNLEHLRLNTVVRWHNLGEVEHEYTPEKLVLSAIFVPKIFTIGRNLTKFWQKISLHSFFETWCSLRSAQLTDGHKYIYTILYSLSHKNVE